MGDLRMQVSIVIDCADPLTLARFWQGLVGGDINEVDRSATWVSLISLTSLGYVGFQKVPESKQNKNRVHLDLVVDDLELSRQRAVELGAEAIGGVVVETLASFQVMSDPEGNEFCFVHYPDRTAAAQ